MTFQENHFTKFDMRKNMRRPIRCDLSFHEQVDRLVSQSAQTMYALRMLRSQGLSGPNLWEVAEATLVSRLSYASQVWWGMIRESERL